MVDAEGEKGICPDHEGRHPYEIKAFSRLWAAELLLEWQSGETSFW